MEVSVVHDQDVARDRTTVSCTDSHVVRREVPCPVNLRVATCNVVREGVEPSASSLSEMRSNHLSYRT